MAELNELEKQLASWSMQKFRDAMMAKAAKAEEWMEELNAWNNSLYEDQSAPSYKSTQTSNFIFSAIESMRPIMFDNDPKFEALPVTIDSMEYLGDINQALDYEWHRTGMTEKTISNSIYTLCIGTSVFMLPYAFENKPNSMVDGDVKPIQVSPFNLFPDPLATNVEDAEYIIYATYQHVNVLKTLYPDKAEFLDGADVQYLELVNYRSQGSRITNQVLVLEMHMRDYTTVEVEEENDGVTTKKTSMKYPLGRVLTTAPDLNLVLKDEPNPYETGRFPFFIFKDIDVPFQFWGEGEVKWLLSPQQAINDLSNQIIDNAKHTANQIWIIDKNAGIPQGQLTNRPGLVIRKNPGSSVERPSPPSMPMYVSEKINSLKNDIEVISGVHDVTRGQNPSGIESGTAIIALQEAANTRIRLKVKLHECSLGEMGQEWLSRMQQFWKVNRLIPVVKEQQMTAPVEEGQPIPEQAVNPAMATQKQYDFITISRDKQLAQSYRVKVVGSSTMQVNNASMFDLMIRLAQTPAEDGMPMVSRDAVLDFVPKVNKERIMQHFQKQQQIQLQQQQAQQMSQDGMGQIQEIMGGMNQQMQGINSDLGAVQGRFAEQDQKAQEDQLKSQGYDQGAKEAMASQMTGGIPDELMQQLASMPDEELAQFLMENPDIASQL